MEHEAFSLYNSECLFPLELLCRLCYYMCQLIMQTWQLFTSFILCCGSSIGQGPKWFMCSEVKTNDSFICVELDITKVFLSQWAEKEPVV